MNKLYLMAACALMLAINATHALADHGEGYTVTLNPINDSGVSGEGTIDFGGDGVTTSIQASGLVPEQVHEIHIHGIDDQDISCPTGMVSHEDMESAVGGHVLDLEPYPTADADGNISLEQTYTEGIENLGPIENRIVAVHGMNMNGEYMSGMPVACGEIVPEGEEAAASPTPPDTGGISLTLISAAIGAGALVVGAFLLTLSYRRSRG